MVFFLDFTSISRLNFKETSPVNLGLPLLFYFHVNDVKITVMLGKCSHLKSRSINMGLYLPHRHKIIFDSCQIPDD